MPVEHATAAGDVELVNDLLAAGADGKAGWKGCFDRSLLCAAIQGGNHAVVSVLPKAGGKADVNISSGSLRWAPLHHAVSSEHEAIVKLLWNGAKTNSKDAHGDTPLHIAADQGHEGIVS